MTRSGLAAGLRLVLRIIGAPEVGLDDGRVALHLLRTAPAITLPKFSTTTCSRQTHDQGHVVLDQQHADVLLGDAADQSREFALLGRVGAGGRLVEQQQLGPVPSARAISSRRCSP